MTSLSLSVLYQGLNSHTKFSGSWLNSHEITAFHGIQLDGCSCHLYCKYVFKTSSICFKSKSQCFTNCGDDRSKSKMANGLYNSATRYCAGLWLIPASLAWHIQEIAKKHRNNMAVIFNFNSSYLLLDVTLYLEQSAICWWNQSKDSMLTKKKFS